MHYCKVIMVGRATADPVVRSAGSGVVANFGFVVNERTKRKGEWVDDPMFIDVAAFGDVGQRVADRVRKGLEVLVEGRLKLSTWTDKDGKTRRAHSVIADAVILNAPPKPKPPTQTSEPSGSPEGDALFPCDLPPEPEPC